MYSYFLNKIIINQKYLVVLLVFSIIFFGASVGYVVKKNRSVGQAEVAGVQSKSIDSNQFYKYISQKFVSRGVMVYAQDIIRQESSSPPQTARFYAYVSSIFNDVYQINKDISSALYATKDVINTIYPSHKQDTDLVMQTLNKNQILVRPVGKEGDILDQTINWTSKDGADGIFFGNTKEKEGWEEVSNELLISPMAGTWKRWMLQDDMQFNIQKPMGFDTNEYNQEIQNLVYISKNLTPKQKNTALYWINLKGTEGNPGIWQNRLYDEIDFSKISEADYAKIQKHLASAIADTTIEVWKIKYQYWTPRIESIKPEITGLIPSPFSPNYVSEYAAVGYVASAVLSHYIPNKQDVFTQDAKDARDSGLWGSILLDRDNKAGYELGGQIATEILKSITK